MEYFTDSDFPNQYAESMNVGLCDTGDNSFSSSNEQLIEPCDNLGKKFINNIIATLILTLSGFNLQDFLLFAV